MPYSQILMSQICLLTLFALIFIYVLTVVYDVTYVLYMCLIHVKGMKTKKNNDKINKKKKNMKRIIKSDPPHPKNKNKKKN